MRVGFRKTMTRRFRNHCGEVILVTEKLVAVDERIGGQAERLPEQRVQSGVHAYARSEDVPGPPVKSEAV